MTGEALTVSVVIPFRNRFELVYEAIDSVLIQTVRALEVVLVDDASKGKFSLDRYTDSSVPIRYFRNERNVGPAASRFVGLSKSKGQFIVFLDSDDVLENTYLERQVATMRKLGNPALVYCFTKRFSRKGIISDRQVPQVAIDRILPDIFLKGRVWCTSACLWRKSVLNEVAPFDGYVWEDYRMDVSAALINNRVGCTLEYLCYYRVDSDEKLSTQSPDYLRTLYSVDGILRTIFQSGKKFPAFEFVIAKMANKYLTCLIQLNNDPGVGNYCSGVPYVKLFPTSVRGLLAIRKFLPGRARLWALRLAKKKVKRILTAKDVRSNSMMRGDDIHNVNAEEAT